MTTSPTLSEFAIYPNGDDQGAGWAHVSGWVQLSGSRRSVSCVIPTRDRVQELLNLLPRLSDALTESGFPWEILIVDAASRDATVRIVREWCEVPGYRLAVSPRAISRAQTIVAGLELARGDAVLVVDAHTNCSPAWVPNLIARWEDGAKVIHAPRTNEFADNQGPDPADAGASRTQVAIDGRDFDETTGNMVLLDRRIVGAVLGRDD